MNMRIMLNILATLGELRQHDHWTRAQLEAHQADALHRLRAYAYAESPFYQQFHKGHMGRPLSELPVLTKSMVMDHFDDLVTNRAIRLETVKEYVASFQEGERYLDHYCVNATTGRTGQPGLFLFDDAEWTTVLSYFARAHEWAGLKVSKRKKLSEGRSSSCRCT